MLSINEGHFSMFYAFHTYIMIIIESGFNLYNLIFMFKVKNVLKYSIYYYVSIIFICYHNMWY